MFSDVNPLFISMFKHQYIHRIAIESTLTLQMLQTKQFRHKRHAFTNEQYIQSAIINVYNTCDSYALHVHNATQTDV